LSENFQQYHGPLNFPQRKKQMYRIETQKTHGGLPCSPIFAQYFSESYDLYKRYLAPYDVVVMFHYNFVPTTDLVYEVIQDFFHHHSATKHQRDFFANRSFPITIRHYLFYGKQAQRGTIQSPNVRWEIELNPTRQQEKPFQTSMNWKKMTRALDQLKKDSVQCYQQLVGPTTTY
jgi:hypothetical protein